VLALRRALAGQHHVYDAEPSSQRVFAQRLPLSIDVVEIDTFVNFRIIAKNGTFEQEPRYDRVAEFVRDNLPPRRVGDGLGQ
jgi:hypothetical protein